MPATTPEPATPHGAGHCEPTRHGMRSIRGVRRRNGPLRPAVPQDATRLGRRALRTQLAEMRSQRDAGAGRCRAARPEPTPAPAMTWWRWLRTMR